MYCVYVKTQRFLKRFNNLKQNVSENKKCSTVTYVQGQSPENKIREYFYYIDHQGMVGRFYLCILFSTTHL